MDEYTIAKEFVSVFCDSSATQFHCLLKTLSNHQIKIIVTICYNILENKLLNLTQSEKQKLKPHLNVYILLCDKVKSNKFKNEIISRNPVSIRKLFKVLKVVNGRI